MPARSRSSRRGTIIVLAAVLMVVMVGVIAFAVDIGRIVTVRSELQTVADSAALAGVSQLLDRDALRGSPNPAAQIAAARAEAARYAEMNGAGGVRIGLSSNPDNSVDGDFVVGHLRNPGDQSSRFNTTTRPYNAVSVTARRSGGQNGSLRLFFAPILGRDLIDVSAKAVAVYNGQIGGFTVTGHNPSVTHSKLLPFALDVDVWNEVSGGNGPDQWSFDPSTGVVSAGGDGIREGRLYGSKTGSPGNFGTVNIGTKANAVGHIVRQIYDGPSKRDFDAMGGKLELGADGTTTLTGDPGLSAGFKSALESIIGQPRIVPLYSNISGNGNRADYLIVGFGGIVITDVQMTGSNKSVTFQPEYVVDPTAIAGNGAGTSDFVYRPMMLAR